MKIPLAWAAQLLGISTFKAKKRLRSKGNEIDTEVLTDYVEKAYKNNKSQYNYLIECINKIEMKGGD